MSRELFISALVAASVLLVTPVSTEAGTRQELDECTSLHQGVGDKGYRVRVCPQPWGQPKSVEVRLAELKDLLDRRVIKLSCRRRLR